MCLILLLLTVFVLCLCCRWRKLLKSFYNEKKQQFDISKVPDIYDSAKYDAIHNSHLDLTPLKVNRALEGHMHLCVIIGTRRVNFLGCQLGAYIKLSLPLSKAARLSASWIG